MVFLYKEPVCLLVCGRSMARDVPRHSEGLRQSLQQGDNFSGCSSLLHVEFKFRCRMLSINLPMGGSGFLLYVSSRICEVSDNAK